MAETCSAFKNNKNFVMLAGKIQLFNLTSEVARATLEETCECKFCLKTKCRSWHRLGPLRLLVVRGSNDQLGGTAAVRMAHISPGRAVDRNLQLPASFCNVQYCHSPSLHLSIFLRPCHNTTNTVTYFRIKSIFTGLEIPF